MKGLLKHKKAVIFDLDWTIYDAGLYHDFLWGELSRWISDQHDLDYTVANDLLNKIWEDNGPSTPNLFDLWLEGLGIHSRELVKECVLFIHQERELPIQPYQGIIEILQSLKGEYHLGLLTEGREKTQRRKFDQLGLEEFFDVFLTTEVVGQVKKTGEPYRRICEMLNVEAKETLSIGDTYAKDIVPPVDQGASGIWMLTNPFEKEQEVSSEMISVRDTIHLRELLI